MAKSEVVVYNGLKYRRYEGRDYYAVDACYIRKGYERSLHRQVWRDANGPIPDGHHIHHIDGNPLNNSLDNLQCVTVKEHLGPLAVWHRTPRGRAVHRALASIVWENPKATSLVCELCGKPFDTICKNGYNRFCSNNCKTKARKLSGVDDEQRTCPECGKVFTINKYKVQTCCGHSCGNLHRKRQIRKEIINTCKPPILTASATK
jgi:endogenous inhibitor of DNA gyrase (YacG/DUF329 family)